MESKIEKIEGAYDIPILKDKLNRVIDYLNSQDQEEICTHDFDLNNRCTKCGVRGVKDMIAELQDTPEEKEEWRGEDWKLDIRTCLLFDDKTQSLGMIMSHEQIQDLEDFISQLLEERTEEAKQEVIDDIWEEAKELAGWDEHEGVIPINQVENCLPEAIKSVEEKLSK
jgi:hypothetical protein